MPRVNALKLVPAESALDRRDDVQALAAGRLDEALEAELVRAGGAARTRRARRAPSRARRPDRDRTPSGPAARRLSACAAPGVDLERAELRERDQARACRRPSCTRRSRRPPPRSATRRIGGGEPGSMCFWKKHGLPRPSGQRTSVSGRFATCGSIQSATTARYAISSPFVMPCSGYSTLSRFVSSNPSGSCATSASSSLRVRRGGGRVRGSARRAASAIRAARFSRTRGSGAWFECHTRAGAAAI